MCKKKTPIFEEILSENHWMLDLHLEDLKKCPATWSRDSLEMTPSSCYPVPWALLGDGCHYHSTLKYNDHVDNTMPQELIDLDSHGPSAWLGGGCSVDGG
jgi:hypothetical protein